MKNLLDIYKTYWRPFGEILTDMEREGMCIDAEHAKSIV
jgi:DNA polymerase-1